MSEPAIYSRHYDPKMACEQCVFGTGGHAEWCRVSPITTAGYTAAGYGPVYNVDPFRDNMALAAREAAGIGTRAHPDKYSSEYLIQMCNQ